MSVCCECCVLSGRVLCDGLITRPEESWVCASPYVITCNNSPYTDIERVEWVRLWNKEKFAGRVGKSKTYLKGHDAQFKIQTMRSLFYFIRKLIIEAFDDPRMSG
jgi:hypothetical protein